MGDENSEKTFGTAAPDASVTRADFERALRHLNLNYSELRDSLLHLAAQVVALTDEVTRRVDHVEPQPAAPNTPAREASGTVEQSVNEAVPGTLQKIREADSLQPPHVWLETDPADKYKLESPDVPCPELWHICQARCCKMGFPLSTVDLDEGIIRWDYGRPYLIRQRASDGYCVHNSPETHGCTVHQHRPAVCRRYDCRKDSRIWADFDKRILAPLNVPDADPRETTAFDLMERVQQISAAAFRESSAVHGEFPENEPRQGPRVEDSRIDRRRR